MWNRLCKIIKRYSQTIGATKKESNNTFPSNN